MVLEGEMNFIRQKNEAIFFQYFSSILPPRSSRDKIALHRNFSLRKRFSSVVTGEHYRGSYFNRLFSMSLKANNCGRLSTSAISLNHRSSSPMMNYGTSAERNILDRAHIRASAISLFASELKRRSHSFPRRAILDNVRNFTTHHHHHNSSSSSAKMEGENNSTGTNLADQPASSSTSTITQQKPAKKFEKPSAKPPSILVYTGDRKELYLQIASSLREILPRDVYAVRDLSTKALKYHPWSHDNCACLVVSSTDTLDDHAWSQLQRYFNDSGKMLFVCQNALLADLTQCNSTKKQISLLKSVFDRKASGGIFGRDFETFLKKSLKILKKNSEVNEVFHTKDPIGGYQFAVVFYKKIDQPLLLYMQTSENHKVRSCALFSDATTDQLLKSSELVGDALSRLGVDITRASSSDLSEQLAPKLSPGFFFCQKDRLVLDINNMTYGKLFDAKLGLIFQHRSRMGLEDVDPLPEPTANLLPIVVCRRKDVVSELAENFDHLAYFNALTTKRLGRRLLYVPVCTTTIDIAKSLSTAFPDSDGILISAGYQLQGRGRGGNVWLSPKGCAVLHFNFNIPADSELGKSITFVQHILAVSIVDAILTRAGDPNFPIKIKWPNDIYYKRNFKLGGILVTASHHPLQYECSIAAGINISNAKPTVCVNNFLPTETSLKVEEYLAETMNKFEYYVNMFVNEGKEQFVQQYRRFWMHNNEEVTVLHEDSHTREKVVIRGLDENGFLEVQSKQTGRVFSVQDDGNSFDMMQGLIHPKSAL